MVDWVAMYLLAFLGFDYGCQQSPLFGAMLCNKAPEHVIFLQQDHLRALLLYEPESVYACIILQLHQAALQGSVGKTAYKQTRAQE